MKVPMIVRSLGFALLLAAPLAAQSPAMPADTSVHTGILPNGLRYFVQRHRSPEARLELRLVVRAGSVLEDDDQKGLAHFVEHMAFNGTTRFKKQELVQYLESIGVRFGADLNASTAFDETTYILPVPTDKPGLVERAFDILQDWAAGVQFDSAEVIAERGVVLGEWREGLGAGSRVRDRELPVLLPGSRYAARLPIGDTAIVAHAEPAPIRRFYRDWYRPDLMAVVAVGDVPVERLEALIKDRFSVLGGPANPRPRVDVAIPETPGTRVSIVTDPELDGESLMMYVRRPSSPPQRTEADLRSGLIRAFVGDIARLRLRELARKPETPFANGYFGLSRFLRDVTVFELGGSPKAGRSAEAFAAILLEKRRMELHGVLAPELEREKADFLRFAEQDALEAAKSASDGLAEGLVQAFLSGSTILSADTRLEVTRRVLPMITLADVNAAAREMARGTDRFIALRAPAKAGLALPSRDTLLAILARSDSLTPAPWTETASDGPLVATLPAPGRVVKTIAQAAGITEWRLSNGARVLIKPTDFKADQVLVRGESPGGMTLVEDKDLISAIFAAPLVQSSGYGAFDATALQRRLAGKVVSLSAQIGEESETIGGLTTPKDLETFLQLLHLAVASPKIDSTATAAFTSRVRSALANRDALPSVAFTDTMTQTLAGHTPRARPLTAARLAELDPARALAIYRERFANMGDFTFTIVGNVSPDSLRPLVEQWIGSLPGRDAHEAAKVRNPSPPGGVYTKLVHKGKEPVAQQVVAFTGPLDRVDSWTEFRAFAAGEILQTRLLETLREAMGATYGVEASSLSTTRPRKQYVTVIAFQSTPAQVDSLWVAAQQTIAAFRDTGPTPAELQKFAEQTRRTMEVGVKTNGWWSAKIAEQAREGRPFAELLDWKTDIDGLTAPQIRDAARRVLDPARVGRFVLLPEATATP